MITDDQRAEFVQGFITAMLWASGGEPDYSEAPEGYGVKLNIVEQGITKIANGWRWKCGDKTGSGFTSERQAIAAAWEHSGQEAPTLESLEDFELSDDARDSLTKDCHAFIEANADDLAAYAQRRAYDPSQGSVWEYAGHDFFLTAAGHGVGFWGRGLGELGDRLTAASEPFHFEPYIGDDGLVYL